MAHGLPHGHVLFWSLLSDSLTTPLQNAYYTELGLDPCPLMVPDLMHDTELGLERHKQLHDLRILHAVGKGAVQKFDARSVTLNGVVCSHL